MDKKRPPKEPLQSPSRLSYNYLWDAAERAWAEAPRDRPSISELVLSLRPPPIRTPLSTVGAISGEWAPASPLGRKRDLTGGTSFDTTSFTLVDATSGGTTRPTTSSTTKDSDKSHTTPSQSAFTRWDGYNGRVQAVRGSSALSSEFSPVWPIASCVKALKTVSRRCSPTILYVGIPQTFHYIDASLHGKPRPFQVGPVMTRS